MKREKERRGLQAALRTDNALRYAVLGVNSTREEKVAAHCVVCGNLFSTRCPACMARAFSKLLARSNQ